MNIALIYRETLNSRGELERIDPIELDANTSLALKWARLYKLQSPLDERDRYEYKVCNIKVN